MKPLTAGGLALAAALTQAAAIALILGLAGEAAAGVPGVPSLPKPWVGSVVRYVALNPEQQRAGLDGADVFYGLEAGIQAGRFDLSAEVTTGDAIQRLNVDGAEDPEIRIYTAAAQLQAGIVPALPVYGYAGAGIWRFDYRDQTTTLAFPASPPIVVAFQDFFAPALSCGVGAALNPKSWLGVGADLGVMGLRLNEARIDGSEVAVESHWRASPTAALRVRFMF